MALTWILSEITTKVRELTGRKSTTGTTNATLYDKINDFYQNRFPVQVNVAELRSWLTQLLAPTDSGEYTLDATVLRLLDPVKIDGSEVDLYIDEDHERFFRLYPKDTGEAYVISDAGAGLAIGTSSTSAVKNGNAFYYDISGDSYYKAADVETELSGDAVPQNKYGAWRLEINSSGTISIVEADDNATGYDSPGLAIEDIADESSERACMGYVTVINTSGTFTPGTTGLDASGVTDTYTDGWHSTRARPEAVLNYGTKIYVGPKADHWRELKAPYIVKPTALDSVNDTAPPDVRWGPCIAYGTAIEILEAMRDIDNAMKLTPAYNKLKSELNSKFTTQKGVNRVTLARF
jgi:hypothetical protein